MLPKLGRSPSFRRAWPAYWPHRRAPVVVGLGEGDFEQRTPYDGAVPFWQSSPRSVKAADTVSPIEPVPPGSPTGQRASRRSGSICLASHAIMSHEPTLLAVANHPNADRRRYLVAIGATS